MPEFWIDSNIFMMARRGVFAFDISPRFWNHLDNFARSGRVSSPIEVYNELHNHFDSRDILIRWIRVRSDSHFEVAADPVQNQVTQIADYVIERYSRHQVDEFLRGADPWLIAHAAVSGGQIVTNERKTDEPNPNRTTGLMDCKIKIPNIGYFFGVSTTSLTGMLRGLGVNDL